MAKGKSKAARSKPTPAASSASPLKNAELDAAYAALRKSVGNRKAKGDSRKIKILEEGKRLLDGALQGPTVVVAEAQKYCKWLENEVDELNLPPVPRLNFCYAVLRLLQKAIASKELETGKTDSSSCIQALAIMVASVAEHVKTLMDNDDNRELVSVLYTKEWIKLLGVLLQQLDGGRKGAPDTSGLVCDVLWLIVSDETDTSGLQLLLRDDVFGCGLFGDLLFKTESASTSLTLFRIANRLVAAADDGDRRSVAEALIKSEWSKPVRTALVNALLREDAPKGGNVGPKFFFELVNDTLGDNTWQRPWGFQFKVFTVNGKSRIDNDKSRRRLRSHQLFVYADRWVLLFKPFGDSGLEEDYAFPFERVCNFEHRGEGGATVAVEFGIYKDQIDEFMECVVPRIPKTVSAFSKPDGVFAASEGQQTSSPQRPSQSPSRGETALLSEAAPQADSPSSQESSLATALTKHQAKNATTRKDNVETASSAVAKIQDDEVVTPKKKAPARVTPTTKKAEKPKAVFKAVQEDDIEDVADSPAPAAKPLIIKPNTRRDKATTTEAKANAGAKPSGKSTKANTKGKNKKAAGREVELQPRARSPLPWDIDSPEVIKPKDSGKEPQQFELPSPIDNLPPHEELDFDGTTLVDAAALAELAEELDAGALGMARKSGDEDPAQAESFIDLPVIFEPVNAPLDKADTPAVLGDLPPIFDDGKVVGPAAVPQLVADDALEEFDDAHEEFPLDGLDVNGIVEELERLERMMPEHDYASADPRASLLLSESAAASSGGAAVSAVGPPQHVTTASSPLEKPTSPPSAQLEDDTTSPQELEEPSLPQLEAVVPPSSPDAPQVLKTISKSVAKPASKPSSKAASKPASKPTAELPSKPAIQPVSQPPSTPKPKASSTSANKSASNSVPKTAPSSKPASASVSKTLSKAVQHPVGSSASTPASSAKPVSKDASKSTPRAPASPKVPASTLSDRKSKKATAIRGAADNAALVVDPEPTALLDVEVAASPTPPASPIAETRKTGSFSHLTQVSSPELGTEPAQLFSSLPLSSPTAHISLSRASLKPPRLPPLPSVPDFLPASLPTDEITLPGARKSPTKPKAKDAVDDTDSDVEFLDSACPDDVLSDDELNWSAEPILPASKPMSLPSRFAHAAVPGGDGASTMVTMSTPKAKHPKPLPHPEEPSAFDDGKKRRRSVDSAGDAQWAIPPAPKKARTVYDDSPPAKRSVNVTPSKPSRKRAFTEGEPDYVSSSPKHSSRPASPGKSALRQPSSEERPSKRARFDMPGDNERERDATGVRTESLPDYDLAHGNKPSDDIHGILQSFMKPLAHVLLRKFDAPAREVQRARRGLVLGVGTAAQMWRQETEVAIQAIAAAYDERSRFYSELRDMTLAGAREKSKRRHQHLQTLCAEGKAAPAYAPTLF